MAQTIGSMVAEARTFLQDKLPLPAVRYSDAEMMEAFNGALAEARAKRPDLFLALGMRRPLPTYTVADFAVTFPLDRHYIPAFVSYLVGRAELREDPFATDGRAVVMMNKFVNGLLKVES